jgi:prepilin-type processing-associated H-X9-DG protein
VWNCPSAKQLGGATFMIPTQDWLSYFQVNEGAWGAVSDAGTGPCHWTWPNGWGGDVTDTILQGRFATAMGGVGTDDAAHKAFVQSIATRAHWDMKMVQIDDPVKFSVCSDGGSNSQDQPIGNMAYPDLCCVDCMGINWSSWSWPEVSDPIKGITDCPSGDYCPECWASRANLGWFKDPDAMSAAARHLGGVNVGFADGHASWIHSRRLLTLFAEGDLTGTSTWCSGTSRADYEANCGTPPAGAEFLW